MAIKFATNVPQTLIFPYGDYMEVNGQYGQQFLYTVEVDGHRDKLYATPMLHDQIQTDGIGPGSVLTITKVEGEGNRKDWLIGPNSPAEALAKEGGNGNGNPVDSPDTPDDRSRTDATPRASSDNGRPPPPDFASMQRLVTHCLQTSWNAWNRIEGGEARFTSEDVCKLGISVFIECCRKGITPSLAEIPAGLEDENEADLPF